MSTHDQRVSFWEDLDRIDRGYPASLANRWTGDNPTSLYNKRCWIDCLKLTTLIWFDLHPGSPYTKKSQLLKFFIEVRELDPLEVLAAFKLLADEWLDAISFSYHEFTGPSGWFEFKAHMNAKHPLCGFVMFPWKDVVKVWFSTEDPTVFWTLRQIWAFPLRINFLDRKELETKALTSYLACEERLQALQLPDIDLSERIGQWFPTSFPYVFENWVPKHGSGTVSDVAGKSLAAKYGVMCIDEKLAYLDRRLPFTKWHSDFPFFRSHYAFCDRVSEVLFVPKAWDKLRTICREPAVLQWYEQGFRRSICYCIDNSLPYVYRDKHKRIISVGKHPLHDRIRLREPDRNRELARLGSISGELDTIDLSDASDSVSYDLVKTSFRKSCLLPVIIACRSSHARIPGKKEPMPLAKYAPMGSALCFPIMCIVFCALCEEAITMVEGPGAIQYSKYSVYGDDIVIEHRYVSCLMDLLDKFGFRVNYKKSFVSQFNDASCIFRESCGGEYLDGVDVTPTRISRKFTHIFDGVNVRKPTDITSSDARAIVAMIDLINSFDCRLKTVRGYLIHKLNQLPPHLRPCFSEDGDDGIKSPCPTNFQLSPPNLSEDLQRLIWRCGRSVCNSGTNEGDEELRLLEWLRSNYTRRSSGLEDPEEKHDRTLEPAVAWVSRINKNIQDDQDYITLTIRRNTL